MNKTWPTLFKTNSNGSTQQWTISVHTLEGSMVPGCSVYIQKEYGQVGGKLQISDPDWIKGKNVGRANETTDYDQAILEAQAQWVKKKTGGKGYVESMESAAAGEVDELVEGGVDVMLAKTYGMIRNGVLTVEQGKKINYPALAQYKLNGHRRTAIIKDGKVTMWTRTRKRGDMTHVIAQIESMGLEDRVLDGELYNHKYADNLEELSHIIAHDSPEIEYHIYDLADSGSMARRISVVEDILDEAVPGGKLCGVTSRIVNSEEELVAFYFEARDNQYEGVVVRNLDAPYDFKKRSSNLQKLKGWISKEFLIVDVEEGRGKAAGKAKFKCVTGADDPIPGVLFDCTLAASQERRAEIWENKEEYIGKWLTVKFSYYTKAGAPFHLTGEAIRDYE